MVRFFYWGGLINLGIFRGPNKQVRADHPHLACTDIGVMEYSPQNASLRASVVGIGRPEIEIGQTEPAPEYTFDQSLPDEFAGLHLSSGTSLTESPSHRDLTPPAIPCLSASLPLKISYPLVALSRESPTQCVHQLPEGGSNAGTPSGRQPGA